LSAIIIRQLIDNFILFLYFGLDTEDKIVAGDTIMTCHWLCYTMSAIYRLKGMLKLMEGIGIAIARQVACKERGHLYRCYCIYIFKPNLTANTH
jgi:hypothetical protein